MPELTLDTAENLAIALVVLFVVGGILSAWLVRKVVAKVISIALFALLAFAVWSNREALQDCADKVSAALERSGGDAAVGDNECTIFGFTVEIPDPDGA